VAIGECGAPSAVTAQLFQRGGGNQFLKTRIVPQWLKHWIQPEQCRSKRPATAGKLLLRLGRLQRVFVIGVPDGLSDGEGVVATFFLIKYQTVIASRREISFARQFSNVSLTNRIEINFSRQVFGISLFINSVQENFRDTLAKCSEANPKRASVADSPHAP
jgi:hypothetical protein